MSKINSVLVSVFLATIAAFLASFYDAFEFSHILLIGVIILMVSLWTVEVFPLWIVSLFPLLLFPVLQIASVQNVAIKYFNPILLLFFGGMLLARAVEKTDLHRYLAGRLLAKLPHTTRGALYALTLTAAFLSALLSNTAVTLILLPLALALTHHAAPKVKPRLLLALAFGAGIGGILTPIGTPPNLIALGFLKGISLEAPSFILWIIMMAPMVVLLLFLVPLVLSWRLHSEKFKSVPVKFLNGEQRKLLALLIILVLVLLANTPLPPLYPGLGLNENYVLLVFGLLLFIPGIRYLDREDLKHLPYPILLLFGAGFALAFAVIHTGLVKALLPSLMGIASLPLFWVCLIVSVLVSAATEVTSNTALASIAVPFFYEFAQASGLDPLLFVLIPAIAASFAFMLPIATPPNAIVFASKEIKVRDMIIYGFIVTVIAMVLLAISAAFYWTLFI